MWWDVDGVDYVLWRRLLEEKGDRSMRCRLDAVHAARQSGCKSALALPDGSLTRMPMMVIAEAAVAAQSGMREEEWQEAWTGSLLNLAQKWPDEATIERLVAVLNSMDAIKKDMKAARVWPWLDRPEGKARPR
jgi:hypothetical protein